MSPCAAPRLCLPRAVIVLVLAESAACRATAAETTPEERTAQKLDSVRTDPLALRTFLARMPKGADLHNHLDGAVYAEAFLRVGVEDGLCIDQAAKAFTKAQPIEAGASPQPVCEAGDIPTADVPKNQTLYKPWSTPFPCPLQERDRPRPILRDLLEIRRHRPPPHR